VTPNLKKKVPPRNKTIVSEAGTCFIHVFMRIAIYPGSFDPITNGHLDVIERAARLFDHVIVAVANNPRKSSMFSAEQRVQLIAENVANHSQVEVLAFEGLIVDLAKKKDAVALIRGMRVLSDFEHEFQMAQMNRHLDDSIETVFLIPNERYFFTSSSLIKQVFQFTDREKHLIPANVHAALKQKLAQNH
jgi:pantetheine-phosphate adenylyltransferase